LVREALIGIKFLNFAHGLRKMGIISIDAHQVICQRKACSQETPVCARCGTVRLLPAQSCALLALLRAAPVSC